MSAVVGGRVIFSHSCGRAIRAVLKQDRFNWVCGNICNDQGLEKRFQAFRKLMDFANFIAGANARRHRVEYNRLMRKHHFEVKRATI